MDRFRVGQQVGQYILSEEIGRGSCGVVFRVVSLEDPSPKRVMKVSARNNPFSLRLLQEYNVYKAWEKRQIGQTPSSPTSTSPPAFVVTLPRAYWYAEDATHSCLVMDELGADLLSKAELFRGNRDTVHALGVALQQTLHLLYEMGFTHGDLKPENILCALPAPIAPSPRHRSAQEGASPLVLYLIDFGLSVSSLSGRDKSSGSNNTLHFAGNIFFASRRQHLSPMTRVEERDEYESILYMMLYLYHGRQLPWTQETQSSGAAGGKNYIAHIGRLKESGALALATESDPRWASTLTRLWRGELYFFIV